MREHVYHRIREACIITGMHRIKTFAGARAALQPYVLALPPAHQAYTLTRMRKLMAALDNPQDKLRIVHVAGTSGKTSTSYYIAAMLGEAGQRVGLTVSPHIMEVNERLQLNLLPLAEVAYCDALSEFLALVEPLAVQPTYFELLIAMAYWYFAREAVEYAVVEVGLGGLLDSTNVCSRADKICVITDIGLDHQAILGDTLAAISQQKAGIIQLHNEVFCYQPAPEIMAAVTARVLDQEAKLHTYQYNQAAESNHSMPAFQQRNWQLAAHVFEALRQRDGLSELSFNQWEQTKQTYIPGRMEIVQYKSKTIILDGAHNPQKMQALLASLTAMYGMKPIAVLAAFKPTKDISNCLELLEQRADTIIFTQLSAGAVIEAPETSINMIIKPDIHQAFRQLLECKQSILVVTGSFYLIQAIKQCQILLSRDS